MKNVSLLAIQLATGVMVTIFFLKRFNTFSLENGTPGSRLTFNRLKVRPNLQEPQRPLTILPEVIACRDKKIAEIKERVTGTANREVIIDCSCKLDKSYRLTKRMIFEGRATSGITVDFNGSTIDCGKPGSVNYDKDMIEVRSTYQDSVAGDKKIRLWRRPENVTIKNCKIIGSVRVWGMGKNGESSDIKESSRREKSLSQHVQRVRDNAPKNVLFENIVITGVNRNPFYLAPGVTYSTLRNSEIKGKSNKVGIYLDAESAFNTIENCFIHVSTAEDGAGDWPFVTDRGWPQMAIDGSSRNTIVNNRFYELRNGGIYLYRNCGEGGTIRHTPPEHNTIKKNIFYYKKYRGRNPAIYLGSRDYGFKERFFGHCDADDGRPYGSSSSDKDFARYNVIRSNKFYKRKIWKSNNFTTLLVDATLNDMIIIRNKTLNAPNYIGRDNLLVEDR